MWKGKDRRRHARVKVTWEAILRCIFPDMEEKLDVKLGDISAGGALMFIDRMEVGPYHLADFDSSGRFELIIPLMEGGAIRATIEIRWYLPADQPGLYKVGVEFVGMDRDGQSLLRRVLQRLGG